MRLVSRVVVPVSGGVLFRFLPGTLVIAYVGTLDDYLVSVRVKLYGDPFSSELVDQLLNSVTIYLRRWGWEYTDEVHGVHPARALYLDFGTELS